MTIKLSPTSEEILISKRTRITGRWPNPSGDGDITIRRTGRGYYRAEHWHPSGARAVRLSRDDAALLAAVLDGRTQIYRAPFPPYVSAVLLLDEWQDR